MSEAVLMWLEIVFDVLYLATIWVVVYLMWKKKGNLEDSTKRIGQLFLLAFFLLALGDTGHVGFRVIAYALGGLEANEMLVGLGSFVTAVTVTFFYMLVAEIWRVRFHKERNLLWWSFIVIGFLRLIIMIPTGNAWGTSPTPFNWSLARNIPLMIQGIGIAILILRDALKTKDTFSRNIAIWIFVSYACYLPVILFVNQIPMLGMLMMPKTLAYLAVAFIAYTLFKPKK